MQLLRRTAMSGANMAGAPARAAALLLVLTLVRHAAAVVQFSTSFDTSPDGFWVGIGSLTVAAADWQSTAAAHSGPRGLSINVTTASANTRDVNLQASGGKGEEPEVLSLSPPCSDMGRITDRRFAASMCL